MRSSSPPLGLVPARGEFRVDDLFNFLRFDSDIGEERRAQSAQLVHRLAAVPRVAQSAQDAGDGALDSCECGVDAPPELRTKVAGTRRAAVERVVPGRSGPRIRSPKRVGEALLLTILGAHNAGHCVWSESLQPAFADAAR